MPEGWKIKKANNLMHLLFVVTLLNMTLGVYNLIKIEERQNWKGDEGWKQNDICQKVGSSRLILEGREVEKSFWKVGSSKLEDESWVNNKGGKLN